MNNNTFPSSFQAPNPIFDDGTIGNSIYITDIKGLEKEKDKIDPNYSSFFQNIDSSLINLSNSTQNKELAEWIKSLIAKKKLLEVHNNGFFNQEKMQFSNLYIQYTDYKNYNDWQDHYPSYGINIELVNNNLSNLPNSLKEVYNVGAIWIFGIPCSGYFYHPRDIKNALDEEYLKEFISDDLYKQLNYPLKELKVFYTDSGCWLMYDNEENVYCGGVECGDFYKSSKKLTEVISIIFTKLLNNDEKLNIESFAPKNEA
ncbi:MAG: hypothetical protein ACRBFS_03440 [Aureispira sp.]